MGCAEASYRTTGFRRWGTISRIQTAVLLLVLLAATAIARGYGTA